MAKSREALVIITLFIGALFFLAGLVFTLQGLGIVGPTNGFMFKSQTWINNGVIILVLGIIILGAGFYFRSKRPVQKIPEDEKLPPDDQKSGA
jgi:hypothetical protein